MDLNHIVLQIQLFRAVFLQKTTTSAGTPFLVTAKQPITKLKKSLDQSARGHTVPVIISIEMRDTYS